MGMYEWSVSAVDQSQSMLDVLENERNSNSNLDIVCMDAVVFSQSNDHSPYDRTLLKGMVHLLTQEERLSSFQGFYQQLLPKNGKLLIVHSRHAAETFPFDERTKGLYDSALDIPTLLDELGEAGFRNIQDDKFTYEFPSGSVKVDDWIYVLENRIWTMFSEENINEQQMKDLIDHVKQQYQSPSNFQMTEEKDIHQVLRMIQRPVKNVSDFFVL